MEGKQEKNKVGCNIPMVEAAFRELKQLAKLQPYRKGDWY
jgi:hypothetical protein